MPIRIFLTILTAICIMASRGHLPYPVTHEKQLTSPPLEVLSGRRVSIDLPPGWTVMQKDGDSKWESDCYAFTAVHWSGLTAKTRRIKVHLIRFQGYFNIHGRRCWTISGIECMENNWQLDTGEDYWTCTVLPMREFPVGYVHLGIYSGATKPAEESAFSEYVFRHMRYIK